MQQVTPMQLSAMLHLTPVGNVGMEDTAPAHFSKKESICVFLILLAQYGAKMDILDDGDD